MGAFAHVCPCINATASEVMKDSRQLTFTGRKPASTPATGYKEAHRKLQSQIIQQVIHPSLAEIGHCTTAGT